MELTLVILLCFESALMVVAVSLAVIQRRDYIECMRSLEGEQATNEDLLVERANLLDEIEELRKRDRRKQGLN
jgi:hypothetical protein